MPDLKPFAREGNQRVTCAAHGASVEFIAGVWKALPYGYGDATMPSACAKSHKRRSGLGLQIGIVK